MTTQAEMREIAAEERADLGIGPRDRLDPYALCKLHGINVYPVSSFDGRGDLDAVVHFTLRRASAWSAALIPIESARIILENDSHAPVRRRSSIAHELGHFLLEHPFDEVLLDEDHERQFDAKQEKEAKYVSGELLVPMKAAEQAAFNGWDNARVAHVYGVSEQFAQMQMKGQRVRAQRAARNFRRFAG
ncbi:ImmA/IrrE family metallo-endopeptidase [Microbacterium sp. M1A1_1b]